MAPEPLTKLFTYKNEIMNHKLRNVFTSLCVPQPQTNNMKNSFMYDGAHHSSLAFSALENEIDSSLSLAAIFPIPEDIRGQYAHCIERNLV